MGLIRVSGQTIKLGEKLDSVRNIRGFTRRNGETVSVFKRDLTNNALDTLRATDGAADAARVVKVGGKDGLITRFIKDESGSVNIPSARQIAGAGVGNGGNSVPSFTTNGNGTHLIRNTTVDGTDIQINSGHAYNRRKRLGNPTLRR